MKLDPKQIRRSILKMGYDCQGPHIACAFSLVEILCAIFEIMDLKEDRLILSKGHGAMALYACQKELGLITQKDLDDYGKDGSKLFGAVHGYGSLGHGLPVAVGTALALRRSRRRGNVYCLVGDGELQEGSNWEAIAFAAHHKLANLTLIVDSNGFQALGSTEQIMNMGPIEQKLNAFGLNGQAYDGHDITGLKRYIEIIQCYDKPCAVVAKTTKGYGLSFTQGNDFHYPAVNKEQYEQGIRELS